MKLNRLAVGTSELGLLSEEELWKEGVGEKTEGLLSEGVGEEEGGVEGCREREGDKKSEKGLKR